MTSARQWIKTITTINYSLFVNRQCLLVRYTPIIASIPFVEQARCRSTKAGEPGVTRRVRVTLPGVVSVRTAQSFCLNGARLTRQLSAPMISKLRLTKLGNRRVLI